MREIEILFRLDEPVSDVVRKLQQFRQHGTQHIVDIYFTHPGMPQLDPVGYEIFESVRLRQKGDKAFITWKHNHMKDGAYLYADEEEVAADSFEKTLRLLRSLGFKELVKIENVRTTFTTEEYEIVIDDVKELGTLMEIEHRAPADRPAEEIIDEMKLFLHTTGIKLGEELHLGKPELMLQKRGED